VLLFAIAIPTGIAMSTAVAIAGSSVIRVLLSTLFPVICAFAG